MQPGKLFKDCNLYDVVLGISVKFVSNFNGVILSN